MSHTLTEGGQITTHRFRMFKQVIKVAALSSFFFALLIFILLMIKTPKLYYWGTFYYVKAWALSSVFSHIQVDKSFYHRVANVYSNSDPSISANLIIKLTYPMMVKLLQEVQRNLFFGLLTFLSSIVLIISFFSLKGYTAKKEKHLSGQRMTSSWFLEWRLKLTGKASKIKIGSLPLVKGTETRHVMITGSTGSGKSNCLHHLLRQIRNNKQKTVVVDTSGIFLKKYYRPNKDVILNPFDDRSAKWSPWAEGETSFDYADIAESFIPHSNSENEGYWREAARSVFISLLEKFADTKRTSELNRWINYEPLINLCKLLTGTSAAAHMDASSEKTASSVRSVCSAFLSSLKSLSETDTPFTIRNWLAEDNDSWLFIQCSPKERTFLRPLMAAWISASIRGLLALPVDLERRIWYVIDELPTLQRVKDLEVLLTEGRKYGGCGVIVLQTPAQLEEIYGREMSQIITANTGTKVIFQEDDPVIADRISRAFGEREISERQEGISYGAHETRDSVSLSSHKKTKRIVTTSQILQLTTNTAFVKLAAGFGMAKVKLNILS